MCTSLLIYCQSQTICRILSCESCHVFYQALCYTVSYFLIRLHLAVACSRHYLCLYDTFMISGNSLVHEHWLCVFNSMFTCVDTCVCVCAYFSVIPYVIELLTLSPTLSSFLSLSLYRHCPWLGLGLGLCCCSSVVIPLSVRCLHAFYYDTHVHYLAQNNGFTLFSVIGIIDGGTWEHRKRAKEMLETAEKNNLQSLAGRGSHFMGDFLPVSQCSAYVCVLCKYANNTYTLILYIYV